jgi:hypothetical protein
MVGHDQDSDIGEPRIDVIVVQCGGKKLSKLSMAEGFAGAAIAPCAWAARTSIVTSARRDAQRISLVSRGPRFHILFPTYAMMDVHICQTTAPPVGSPYVSACMCREGIDSLETLV